jgi:hypothetical protein
MFIGVHNVPFIGKMEKIFFKHGQFCDVIENKFII